MLLRNKDYDFIPVEPQNDEEPCKKAGLSCLLNLVVDQCIAMVKLNFLFLLGCIPIVTIPLSLFSMNCVMYRIVRDDPVSCLQDFWKTFRHGWKKGYFAFFLTLLPLVCAGFGMWFYFGRADTSLLFLAPFVVCSTIFLVTLMSSGYLYGLLEGRKYAKEAGRLAVFLGITKPLRAVLAALCYYGLPLLAAWIFPLSGLYLLLLGFSFPCLLGNFCLRTVLRQCSAKRDSDESSKCL